MIPHSHASVKVLEITRFCQNSGLQSTWSVFVS